MSEPICPACGHDPHLLACRRYSCRCGWPRKKPQPGADAFKGWTRQQYDTAMSAVRALEGIPFVSRLSLPHDATCECGDCVKITTVQS